MRPNLVYPIRVRPAEAVSSEFLMKEEVEEEKEEEEVEENEEEEEGRTGRGRE